MRQINLSTFLNFGRPLYFGGGGGGGMPASQVQAAPMADTEAAKAKTADANRRRIGGVDALKGTAIADLAQKGKTKTLGGSGYTGEA
jgi:hypothetical protein